MSAHVAARVGETGDEKRKSIATYTKNGGIFLKNGKAPRFFTWDEANFTWISLSLSLKTVQETLFKISLEHHSFVPEHPLKIDCKVGLFAAKNFSARASCVTFRLVYARVVMNNGIK